MAETTLRKHYGCFIHTSVADALELAKIDPEPQPKRRDRSQIGHRLDTAGRERRARPRLVDQMEVEQKGFEPST